MPLNEQSAINSDAPRHNLGLDNQGFTEDGAAEEFLKRFMPADAEKPSGSEDKTAGKPQAEEGAETETKGEEEAPAEKPEAEAEAEETEETEETEAEHKFADDGAYVKVKVGEEEHEVPVKDLQRLYGQEKALTQKSMEVAEQRKAVDAEMAKNTAATVALLERARARYQPFSTVDFNLAAQQLPAEEYTNLRQAAQAAYEDVQFLESHLNGFMQAVQQRQHNEMVSRAKEAIKVLSGPVDQGGIEGWNEQKYGEIRDFGINEGLAPEVVNNLVDPAAIRLLHDAMLFRRGQSKVITKKVNKTPKKVIKTSQRQEAKSGGPDKSKVDAAMKRLQRTGNPDDAAELFLAKWSTGDE